MFSFFQRYRDLLLVGTLLLAPLVTYLFSGHRGLRAGDPNWVDRAVLFLSTPVQSALTWVVEGVGGLGSGYLGLRGAHEDAALCRQELAQAHAELNSLKEAEAENARLKTALGYVEGSADHEIVARVIGLNPSRQFQSIHLNRGQAHGVQVGMPVVTPEGAVGQVFRAADTSSDVMLLTDPASRVSGSIQRTRVRATVTGTGEGRRLSIDLVRREDDMREGDVMVTAGTDGIFPRGVRLGVVHAPERPSVGMFIRASLEPAVELNRVEEVLVVPLVKGVPPAGAQNRGPP